MCLGEWCVACFFRAAFCRSVKVILSYACSFYCRADLPNLIPLIHCFHFQSVVLPKGLHTSSYGSTDSLTDRPA